MGIVVRNAVVGDLEDINRIYRYAVLHTTSSFDIEPPSMDDRYRWFLSHNNRYPVLVATYNKDVIGWGSLSQFAARPGYRFTVEDSIYIDPEYQRIGAGTLILQHLVGSAKRFKYHNIIAVIAGDNEASIKLHRKMGFQTAGCIREAGYKFDRWLDVIYMQYIIGGDDGDR
ncbi:GNAT family N-acetyltransferase [Mahella australiensis]|uniref:Phosphinothricin acetyltransferase n=1 Tax=Mahella australiensis (strain DSM 15567 / CIP 107919 / 50-1 BON) TaxID=697281 RepID=F3ZXV0_MAHA5|nr:GNAT family N-acetyltransferase [Mahella australiensis]AEE96620.1 Phosphinothricin acetyltransferase [Mahella australiensis 50-1 BON]